MNVKAISTNNQVKPMKYTLLTVLLSIFLMSEGHAEKWKLFYLGGQSNMEGFGKVADLPDSLKKTLSDVWIFQSTMQNDQAPVNGTGKWVQLQPGHGSGYGWNGSHQYSDKFGMELTFGRELNRLLPGQKMALIKYPKGGSSLDTNAASTWGCWDPDYRQGNGNNQYDHFLATLRNGLSVADINGDGEPDTLIPAGIIWMQGESDAAFTEEIANRYQTHLKRMMDLFRASLRTDDLPVVIIRISESHQHESGKVWKWGDVVREAQKRYVESDRHAVLVTTTDSYGYSDPYHYDSPAYLDMGIQAARAWNSINPSK